MKGTLVLQDKACTDRGGNGKIYLASGFGNLILHHIFPKTGCRGLGII